MKTIYLSVITQKQNKYEIFLGTGKRLVFTNRKQAAKFLADTNRFLTAQLIEINEMFIAAFTAWRRTWFTLKNVQKGTRISYWKEEQKLNYAMHAAEEIFDKIAFTHHHDAFLIFVNMDKICIFIGEAMEIISLLDKRRNNSISYHILDINKNRLELIRERMRNYPEKNNPGTIDEPGHSAQQ